MEAQTPQPLFPPHLPRDHPVVTRDYSLFTPSIDTMVSTVAQWLDDQVEGGTIYGPSRWGKSNAVDHWLQTLLSERHGGFVPMVIWSHMDSGNAAAVGRFYGGLLVAARHPLAKATRPPNERLHMLTERFVQLAFQGGGRFVVLVIDEAQDMVEREWIWLVQLHSMLEKQRLRLCVISIASVQIFDSPIGMSMTGGAHVAARFMLSNAKFEGISSVDQLEFVLAGYDEGTEWPKDSGISFTEGIAKQAWDDGFRIKHCASRIWDAMVMELPDRYEGPHEFPMKTIAQTSRHVLLRLARNANPSDITSLENLRAIVAGCGHRQLMALVGAVAPSQLRGGK